MTKIHHKDTISEEEFNLIVSHSGVAHPEDDSRGDSATNEDLEVEMGTHFPDEDVETSREISNSDTAAPREELDDDQIDRQVSSQDGRASTWPDPVDLSETGN